MIVFYKAISFALNLISYPSVVFKPKYDILLLQKFGKGITIDNKLIMDSLNYCNIKYVNTNRHNQLFSFFIDLYYIQRSNIIVLNSYSLAASNVKRFKRKHIIQTWHALGAVKRFGFSALNKNDARSSSLAYGLNMHRNYKYVVCCGSQTRPIFEESFKTPTLHLRLPIVDYYKNMERINDTNNILYLPTYRKKSHKGAVDINEIVKNTEYTLIVKNHPNEMHLMRLKDVNYKKSAVHKLINNCDVLITDYSASCFEAALLNKKVIFYMWDYKEYQNNRGLSIDPANLKNVCYTKEELAEMLNNIDKLENSDYLVESYVDAENTFIDYLKKFCDINASK